jgi:hypothetical protein
MKICSLKNIAISILFFFLYGCINTAIADSARTYDVQVLIFSHITPSTLQLEQWPIITAQPPATANSNSSPLKLATQLASEKNVLTHNPNYKILFDGSWIKSLTTGSTVTLPVVSANEKLNGTIDVTLGHYFTVNTNLLLTEPTSFLKQIDPTHYFSKWDQSHFTFQLLQKRRMRSDELNYLEHPVFGMLIKIIPVTDEKKTQ